MADLLECLIQVKAIGDTPRRLAAHARSAVAGGREADAASVAARMAAAEARFAACLEAMLAGDGRSLPPLDLASLDAGPGTLPGESMETFARRRDQVARRLDACSAADFNRRGFEPSRGPMTVADLVAVMLAHDTDQLGLLVPQRFDRIQPGRLAGGPVASGDSDAE